VSPHMRKLVNSTYISLDGIIESPRDSSNAILTYRS
jgi:hypothetical protein